MRLIPSQKVIPVGFLLAAMLIVHLAFPALYGDEYDSLRDAQNLLDNLHAVGYFAQLNLWSRLFTSDSGLRLFPLLWAVLALVWAQKWLTREELLATARLYTLLLLALSAFFWQYALQIRFYSMFLAASLLVFWRCAELRQAATWRNGLWLALALLLLVSSHLFGWLVAGLALFWLLFFRGRRLALALLGIASGATLLLVLWPPLLQGAIALVYRMSNPYAVVPDSAVRGLSLGMIAKIPMTLYTFAVGERLYPLDWWIVLPVLCIVAWCGLRGLVQVRRYPGLLLWTVLGGVSVLALYLLFDPLAPPSLQGASPRYLIFVFPLFWVIVALGAATSPFWRTALVTGQLAVLLLFFFPHWSSAGGDLAQWRLWLADAVVTPEQTCIVVDGRGQGSVRRYAPTGVRIESNLQPCLTSPTVLLVSNDYRLPMVRHFDGWAQTLAKTHRLVQNLTRFPAQISVYRQEGNGAGQFAPARLALPEQDLPLPLYSASLRQDLPGFVRLDNVTPNYVYAPLPQEGDYLLISNLRSLQPLSPGTPVLSIQWHGQAGQTSESVVRAGVETAAWDGSCTACQPVAWWTKRLHLVGAQAYPGAYRHYRAMVWSAPVQPPFWPVHRVTLTLLQPETTFYFWGLFAPEERQSGEAQ